MPEPKSPFKRVRRTFDRDLLKMVCEMHETDFPETYDMSVTGVTRKGWWDSDYPAFHAFKDNGSNILAVAHLDTVQPHEKRTAQYLDTAGGPVIYSGALDDRLGAYTILELLPALGINVDVLLTTGEETGQSTAEEFVSDKDYHWMIEFDRGGTDVVTYQYEDAETSALVRDSGARMGNGIFSDIGVLEHLEIKGFNWGVGYQDYHSPRSHAYLEDYWMMLGHFVKFHDVNQGLYLPHEERRWGSGRSSLSSLYRDVMDECPECGFENDTYDDMCQTCQDNPGWAAAWRKGLDHDDVVDGDVISDDFNVVNGRLLAAEDPEEEDRADAAAQEAAFDALDRLLELDRRD
jgi:hypothetical protein